MIEDAVLDHVAVAAERQADLWPRYAGDLGGRWVHRGVAPGFSWAQVEFVNGMRLEALEPHAVDQDDFLRRFLDRRGPGPHHLTFKVPELAAALDRAHAAGFDPVNVDLSHPQWKEAFLHPKQAAGIVVQLAQSSSDGPGSPPPPGFPAGAAASPHSPASLLHVAHAVPHLDDGLRLFALLLGGTRVDGGDGWVELAWPGPGRVRLLERPGVLAGLLGAVDHLAFACAEPAGVPGARPAGDSDGAYEVAAPANLGTRLRLSATGEQPTHRPRPAGRSRG